MIDQSKLFIIIGLPRSGTSLLQELMNCFEGFCNKRESRIGGPEGRSCYNDVADKNDFTILEHFILFNWTKTFFVEKMPASIYCLPQLHSHFPDANYLFLERDPIKIHLSIMNMHMMRNDEQEYKMRHMRIGEETLDSSLPIEVFVAKEVLDMIKQQTKNKRLFKNELTIRYESLLADSATMLKSLESRFSIKCNYEMAAICLERQSYSSKNNSYNIKEIKDWRALEAINSACNLWGYKTI